MREASTSADERELRVEIHDADPGYVDQRLGGGNTAAGLYTHLRAVPAATAFRRGAIQRAMTLHDDRRASGAPEPEISGLGLLVLQRAMLAVEDLGRALHAFGERPSWKALVSDNLSAISGTFDALFAGGDTAIAAAYRFPTDEALEGEAGLSAEQREALRALRDETLREVREQLARVAELWRLLHRPAKKTLHGLGFIAGTFVTEAPAAGVITRLVDPNQMRPFVVALESTVDTAVEHVRTVVQSITVAPGSVDAFASGGLAACDALELLAAGHLHGLQTNHAFALPKAPVERLSPDHAAALRELFGDDED